jgi:ribosomal protein S18 acetylase RimI-like enzyme
MTMDQNQLLIRSYSPDKDIPQLSSLYSAVEAFDHDGNEINEQALRAQLDLPGHDPLKDRWVVETLNGSLSLIASGVMSVAPGASLAEANVIVHPKWRRRKIGTTLLSKVIQRSRQLDAGAIQIYANVRHPVAPGFLKKHGFVAQGAYTELRLIEDVRLPPVIWPYGYTMRPYIEVQDLSILTQAMNGEPTGYIDAPGVVPQHRRLDLYRALVLTGIKWLRMQGQTLIEMESWGDKLEVLKMYRELGFKDKRQLVSYELKNVRLE